MSKHTEDQPTIKPAEVIARAVVLLREAAALAEDGPWGVTDHDDCVAFGRNDPDTGRALTTIAVIYEGRRAGTARWIAAMDPETADLLARWLETEATRADVSAPALAFAGYLVKELGGESRG